MSVPELVVPVASAAALGVVLRYGSDAVLRLVAGITAIAARDERTRAQRALEVLRTLRRDGQPPSEDGSDENVPPP
jgi:hypothetical protein